MFERSLAMRVLNVLLVASLLLGMAPLGTRAATPPEPVGPQGVSTPQPQSVQAATTIYLPLVLREYVPSILPVTLDQYATPWLLLPGEETTYALVVQNPGVYAVQTGELTAEVPEIVEPVAGGISHEGAYDAQTRRVHWNLPEVEKGATLTVTFRAQVTTNAVATATSMALLTATMASDDVYTDGGAIYLSVGEAVTPTLMPEGGILTVPDKKASLIAPAGAVTQPTPVRLTSFPVPFEVGELPTRWQVFFDVTAMGAEGALLHDADGHTRFLKPLTATIGVQNTWEQPFLVHMTGPGAREHALIAAEFDRNASVLTATLQTFSAYGAGGADPYAVEGAYHLMTNQPGMGMFNGAATYSYQLDVPEGRRGLTPKLSLDYSSSGMNSLLGIVQSGEVGMGWSLGGQVQIVRPMKTAHDCTAHKSCETIWQFTNEFVLTINGTSYNLEDYTKDPNGGCRYDVTDGPGLRVMRYTNPGPGGNKYCGYPGGILEDPILEGTTEEYWEVTMGDGTVYRLGYTADSQQLMRMEWYYGSDADCELDSCTPSGSDLYRFGGYAGELVKRVAHRWSVDRVRDVYGNVIEYGYQKAPQSFHSDLDYTYDRAQHLDWIRYGGNDVQGISGMYLVDVALEWRTTTNDNHSQDGWHDAGPDFTDDFEVEKWSMWQLQRLDRVKVCANPSGYTCDTGTLLAEYDLDYDFVVEDSEKTIETTRLQSITRSAPDENGAMIALPATTFSYVSLKQRYPIKDKKGYDLTYPRLAMVNNGYGGVATFGYEEVAQDYHHSSFYSELDFTHTYKSHRVKTQTTNDGLGHTSTVTYTYEGACFNFWRTKESCSYPGSEPDFSLTGHDNVMQEVWGYDEELLSRTRHWFHYKPEENVYMGREYASEAYAADGNRMQRAETTWMTTTNGSTTFAYAGAAASTDYTGGTPLTTRKEYRYDPVYQGGKQYGLLTHVIEYDSQNVQQRVNFTYYVINESRWLLLPWAQDVFDGSWVWKNVKFYLYDDNTDPENQALSKGELTTVRSLLIDVSECDNDDHTVDISYQYDVYGNVLTTTTYSGYGLMHCANIGGSSDDNWDPAPGLAGTPGGGSAPNVSAVTYDGVYHMFPTETCAAVGTAEEQCSDVEYYGVNGDAGICAAGAGYLFGAVCRQWGPNGASTATHYHYDAFGRKTDTWLPGENVNEDPSERID